jgi:hypothetical protein
VPDDGFVLNRKGGAEVLNALAADAINGLAQQIAEACGPEANVEAYTTDRSAASVSVPADMQAKDGALTKAASSLGLAVTPKKK